MCLPGDPYFLLACLPDHFISLLPGDLRLLQSKSPGKHRLEKRSNSHRQGRLEILFLLPSCFPLLRWVIGSIYFFDERICIMNDTRDGIVTLNQS